MKVFGPVPSRRLGQSIGVNNIPPKICSFSCVYCQIGRTDRMSVQRCTFYRQEEIIHDLRQKLDEMESLGERADFITFVPDGEPTLDKNLGTEIELAKQTGIRTAVITNASLLWMKEVREDLGKADWVSVKVDAVDSPTWKKIDRPHGKLDMDRVLEGTVLFAQEFSGTLVTETMLVKGINDNRACMESIAQHIARLSPSTAYLLVPSRPPAESSVVKPSNELLLKAYAAVNSLGIKAECITGDEGEGFFLSNNAERDLLGIVSVHPVRKDALESIIKKRGIDPGIVKRMESRDLIEKVFYEDTAYYMKKHGKEC